MAYPIYLHTVPLKVTSYGNCFGGHLASQACLPAGPACPWAWPPDSPACPWAWAWPGPRCLSLGLGLGLGPAGPWAWAWPVNWFPRLCSYIPAGGVHYIPWRCFSKIFKSKQQLKIIILLPFTIVLVGRIYYDIISFSESLFCSQK